MFGLGSCFCFGFVVACVGFCMFALVWCGVVLGCGVVLCWGVVLGDGGDKKMGLLTSNSFGSELSLETLTRKKPSANFALIAIGCELPLVNPN